MPKLVVLFYGLLVLLSAGCKKDSVKIITINPLEFSVEDQVKIGEAFQKVFQLEVRIIKMKNGTGQKVCAGFLT